MHPILLCLQNLRIPVCLQNTKIGGAKNSPEILHEILQKEIARKPCVCNIPTPQLGVLITNW